MSAALRTSGTNDSDACPSNATRMPWMGLGTYLLERESIPYVLRTALELGYRRIDCAPVYFNEDAIGDTLAEVLLPDGPVDVSIPAVEVTRDKPRPFVYRSDLYVVSKLASPFHRDVEAAVRKTLNDLRLDYLDLYLVHWPVAFYPVPMDPKRRGWETEDIDDSDGGANIDDSVSIHETWQGMERVVQLGLVRQIGVCNMPVALLHELLSRATIVPMVHQVELHPYLQQERLLKYCRRRGIHVQAYSPLGTPGYKQADEPSVLDDAVLHRLAQRYNVSTATICLMWARQRGTSVVVKSSQLEHLRDNWHADTSSEPRLLDDEMQEIARLDRGYRFFRPQDWWGEKAMAVFD